MDEFTLTIRWSSLVLTKISVAILTTQHLTDLKQTGERRNGLLLLLAKHARFLG